MSGRNGWTMTIASFGGLAAGLGGIALLASVPVPLAAQEIAATSLQPGVCMVRQQAAGSELQSPLTPIVVPVSDTEAMTQSGFGAADCSDVFASADEQRAWRDAICTITATHAEGVQDQLENLLGARPAVLCGMAEQVLGPWQRASGLAGEPPADE
jgi:hypothetical protein